LKLSIIRLRQAIYDAALSVPVRIKISGIMLLPILIMGFVLNYWIRTGLSDWLSYRLSGIQVDTAMEAGGRSVLFVTALTAIISILLTLLLMLVLTRPLLELLQVSKKVTEGDLTSRARIFASDEIGEVSRSFNLMIDELTSNQWTLERANRRLAAVNQVVITAGRELELQHVLQASLDATLEVMGLQSGWIFLHETAGVRDSPLQLESSHGLDREMEIRLGDYPDGSCICQDALRTETAEDNVTIHPCSRLTDKLGREISHITIQLEARGQKFGMINLMCSNGGMMSDEDTEILTTIGAHVSEIVANAWLHASLVEKESARQALLAALVQAQEDERARLARRLHDGAGQSLTSLLVRLKGLESLSEKRAYRDSIRTLCQSVSETIEQVQDISYQLRPAALEEFGLEVALSSLVEEMTEAPGICSECHMELGGQRLPFEVETMLYRIAQESLTNVIRHADAKRIRVDLVSLPYAVCLRVEDDGCGFDASSLLKSTDQRRLGMVGMQERAEMLGGSLEVQSAPGEGTAVQVRIPHQLEPSK